LVANSSIASAAEIKLFSPVAMKGVTPEVVAQFEKSSTHKVKVEYATVGALFERLQKDEGADVAIVSSRQLEDLLKQGKIVASSRADIGRVGVGLFVRAGASRPDIGSVEALKRTLLGARSVSYGDPTAGGVSGVHMAGLAERLGIAADMKAKTKVFANSQAVLEAVSKGEAEIGFGLTSDTALLSGVDLVGALPTEIQNFTVYAAGIPASSKQPDAAKALIGFLTSPATQAILKANGFEPR
jgi:molybdate transport system substrate-binding protein